MLDDRYDEEGGMAGGVPKPRFMTVAECASQMLEIEEERTAQAAAGDNQGDDQGEPGLGGGGVCGPDTLAVGVARLGTEGQRIVSGTLQELASVDLGEPLHSLVVVGRRCHELERDYVRAFAVSGESWDRAWVGGGYGRL